MPLLIDRRSLFASLAATVGTAGLFALSIGGLDIAIAPLDGPSATGQALLRGGAIAAALGITAWLAGAATSRRARGRSAIVAVGIWPFLTFGLFIGWRIGVAGEQAELCEAGEVQACYDLGRRKQRRGKPDEARHWFALGCDGGVGSACLGLAAVTPAAEERGAALRAGCAIDSGEACDRLGRMLRAGDLDGPADEADRVTRRACELGVASACVE